MAKWKEHHCSRVVDGKTVRAQSLRIPATCQDPAKFLLAERDRLRTQGFTTNEDIEPSLLVPDWDGSSTLFMYFW